MDKFLAQLKLCWSSNYLNGTFMILFGVLLPLVLRVWGMAFHRMQAKDDEWVNSFYSMVEISWTLKKSGRP